MLKLARFLRYIILTIRIFGCGCLFIRKSSKG